MLIQVDSREQQNSEVIEYFEQVGQPYFVSKVYAGDYIDFKSPKCVIDLKKDLLELCNNLTKEHERFRNEILRATTEMQCYFIVLVREPFDSLEDVKSWSSNRTKVKGEQLYKIMATMTKKYNIAFRFCTRDDAGAKIIKILKYFENYVKNT